ncbi:hypothetical protein [Aquibium microcysteis]|uniref:hypothetical protein n=1 Tax=Aquibium microcysteis TaxID=675281 RepID=UPI00165D2D50|nr:hypothetical protein [Aquibium microcysteis]
MTLYAGLSPIFLETTGEEVLDGTLAKRVDLLSLDEGYDFIRFIFPDGSSTTKTSKKKTPQRTARSAMDSVLYRGGKNKDRRDTIVQYGSARIEIHFINLSRNQLRAAANSN